MSHSTYSVHVGGPLRQPRNLLFRYVTKQNQYWRVCSVVYFWRESKPKRQPLPIPVAGSFFGPFYQRARCQANRARAPFEVNLPGSRAFLNWSPPSAIVGNEAANFPGDR
jgi:hypothetical protein